MYNQSSPDMIDRQSDCLFELYQIAGMLFRHHMLEWYLNILLGLKDLQMELYTS